VVVGLGLVVVVVVGLGLVVVVVVELGLVVVSVVGVRLVVSVRPVTAAVSLPTTLGIVVVVVVVVFAAGLGVLAWIVVAAVSILSVE